MTSSKIQKIAQPKLISLLYLYNKIKRMSVILTKIPLLRKIKYYKTTNKTNCS